MDYPFENLGPEKFQMFCQALLSRENPNVQCLPVAQPDGGRDAIGWALHPAKAPGFIVYQVKFSRAPLAEPDPRTWLLDVVEGEAPKIAKLIPAGAKEYVLLTNIPGTAHLDAGSIDKLNVLLRKQFNIPATCWWRDDLARKLDDAWDLKWAYPELMTGPDLIRFVVEQGLSEDKERRASAVRAFVSYQHSLDREVKFKQVELQNRLLDLFIDVPIDRGNRFSVARAPSLRRSSGRQRMVYYTTSYYERIPAWELAQVDEMLEIAPREWSYARRGSPVGSASFLLLQRFASITSRVVIEGAPGQGKSTITQYVCQVHRMKLLGVEEELGLIPLEHREAPMRLPVRVDLRDFASWLARENPFTPDGGEVPAEMWNKSLENFLAALIHYQSGGVRFDVSDLHAVGRLSAILIVFDGLDEVADIKKRQEVVDEITKGIDRLQSTAASLQIVVTSRPAAFANSPGFSEEIFAYYDLAAVNQELIDEYASKWLKARQLSGRDANDVRRILKEKLDQPHLRDLARNPMQLAILLSLIHTRGTSLPDKRTALYDSYIELFFNREAEKSPIVRDNRELLINIHRYLAWLLHSEAELGSEREAGRRNGAIGIDRLINTLKTYLSHEGHDPTLADALFKGMVERVVALVSRVEGTYEFEVQPLREYFAARFLYETAPYSPTGAEKAGTKPDRFDAIARDFYWLNVTRFYAGCYSKGELASLIDRLDELVKDRNFRLLSHPRILGSILLSDWVFSQHPRSVKQVVGLIIDGIGLRYVLASSSRRAGTNSPLVLPTACGNNQLVAHCMALLQQSPPMDYSLDLIDVLKANASTNELMELWLKDSRRRNVTEQPIWLTHGLHLGCLPVVTASELEVFRTERPMRPTVFNTLYRARRLEVFENTQDDFDTALDSILALAARGAVHRSRAQS
jgi:NACHT domain